MPAIVPTNASDKQLKTLAKHAANTRTFRSYMRADQAVPICGRDHAAFAYHVRSSHAVRTVPPADLELIAQARNGRLNPGAGTLWLEDQIDVPPDNIAIALSIEVPGAAPVGASVKERARRAAAALDK
jgi:hypothetical protein